MDLLRNPLGFEKRASENVFEKPLAPQTPLNNVLSSGGSGPTPLGTGLRPMVSTESSGMVRRASTSLSRRGSSQSGLSPSEEVYQKMESLALRVAQLERHVNHLEGKLEAVSKNVLAAAEVEDV